MICDYTSTRSIDAGEDGVTKENIQCGIFSRKAFHKLPASRSVLTISQRSTVWLETFGIRPKTASILRCVRTGEQAGHLREGVIGQSLYTTLSTRQRLLFLLPLFVWPRYCSPRPDMLWNVATDCSLASRNRIPPFTPIYIWMMPAALASIDFLRHNIDQPPHPRSSQCRQTAANAVKQLRGESLGAPTLIGVPLISKSMSMTLVRPLLALLLNMHPTAFWKFRKMSSFSLAFALSLGIRAGPTAA